MSAVRPVEITGVGRTHHPYSGLSNDTGAYEVTIVVRIQALQNCVEHGCYLSNIKLINMPLAHNVGHGA